MIPALAKPTRALILSMMALVVITIIFASRHYRRENRSVDPRIVPAREMYAQYNKLAAANDYTGALQLIDSIMAIYQCHPHYLNSFETGVLENNRAAVYLTVGLSYDSLATGLHHLSRDSLIMLGEAAVRNSIHIYESWLEQFGLLDRDAVLKAIGKDFCNEEEFPSGDKEIYLENRVDEFLEAQLEMPRRLSVSYTNLGIVHRYREEYELAARCYQEALELWEDNLSAENNLNLLLGRPLKKRTVIQKLFPKSKDPETE